MSRLQQAKPAASTSNLLPPYKPGQSGNPKGRKMGSRQKLSEKFIDNLADHFEKEGMDIIKRVAEENPTAYLQIICRLLPKDISLIVTQDHSNLLPHEQLKRIAEAWMLSQQDDIVFEGESVVVTNTTAALPPEPLRARVDEIVDESDAEFARPQKARRVELEKI